MLEPFIQLMSHLMDSDQILRPSSLKVQRLWEQSLRKCLCAIPGGPPAPPTHPVQIDKVKHKGQILSSIDLSKHSLTVMSPQYKCNAPTMVNEGGVNLLSSHFAVNDISYVLSIFLLSFTHHLFCISTFSLLTLSPPLSPWLSCSLFSPRRAMHAVRGV